MPRTH
jgi:sulfate permease, SulP family